MWPEACQHYLEQGAGLVVVTRGAEGVCAANRRGLVEVEAPVVKIEDTVGAGDTFQASMVASLFEVGCFSRESLTLLTGESIRSILERAANAAALNCSRGDASLRRGKSLMLLRRLVSFSVTFVG